MEKVFLFCHKLKKQQDRRYSTDSYTVVRNIFLFVAPK